MGVGDDPLSQWFAIPAFFVLFRETLEATVLVAVMVQYLQRAEQPGLIKVGKAPNLFLSRAYTNKSLPKSENFIIKQTK